MRDKRFPVNLGADHHDSGGMIRTILSCATLYRRMTQGMFPSAAEDRR